MLKHLLTALVVAWFLPTGLAQAEVLCLAIDFIFPDEQAGTASYRLQGGMTLPGPIGMEEFAEVDKCFRSGSKRIPGGYRAAAPYIPRLGTYEATVKISGCSPTGKQVWYQGSVTLPRSSAVAIHVPKSALRNQTCG